MEQLLVKLNRGTASVDYCGFGSSAIPTTKCTTKTNRLLLRCHVQSFLYFSHGTSLSLTWHSGQKDVKRQLDKKTKCRWRARKFILLYIGSLKRSWIYGPDKAVERLARNVERDLPCNCQPEGQRAYNSDNNDI